MTTFYELEIYELRDIHNHWGEVYAITWDGSTCHAQRRDNGAELTAPTPEDLRRAIRADYLKHPVNKPRTSE